MEENWARVLVVAFGGAIGSAARYLVATELSARLGAEYPWGTTAVNLCGALIFGIVWSATEAHDGAPLVRLFILTGMMGGLTTFSTLAFEITQAFVNERTSVALTHTLVHAAFGLLTMWLGLGLGRLIARLWS